LAVKRSRKTAGKTRKIKNAKKLAKRSKRVVKSSNLKSGTNIGKLTLRQYVNAKRKAKQNEIREYEQKYLARYKQPKSEVKKPKSWAESDVNLGTLNLRQYVNAKRKAKQNEIREYEKQFLSRYKQPKSGIKKSSNLKHDTDIGTLSLRPYLNAKRKAKQNEIREYEQKYLARYKQPKSGIKKPKSWTESDVDLGTLNLRQYVNAKRKAKQNEIREYEKQFLSRYKQPKSIPVKSKSYLHVPGEPKIDIKKERKDYEKEFLSRYKEQQKAKPKKNVSKLLTPEPKIDRKKERKKYEKEYLSRLKNNL